MLGFIAAADEMTRNVLAHETVGKGESVMLYSDRGDGLVTAVDCRSRYPRTFNLTCVHTRLSAPIRLARLQRCNPLYSM